MDNVATYTRQQFTFDRHAALLAGVLLVVQGGAVWLARALNAAGYEADTPGGGPDATAVESAGTGAAWVGAEVTLAVALLGLILVYRRLPAWLQETIRQAVGIGIFLGIGAYWANLEWAGPGIALTLAVIFAYKVVDHYGLWWVVNNVAAVLLAILAGAAIAFIIGMWGVVVGLVGLTIYDHIFANKREWMFDIATVMLKARLPMLVFWPPTWQYEWAQLWEDGLDDGGKNSGWGIGMADLALPAGFAAAVAVAPVGGLVSGGLLAALGVIAGVTLAAFRLRFEMLSKGSGAGLPAIAAGALGGWVVAQVPVRLVGVVGV